MAERDAFATRAVDAQLEVAAAAAVDRRRHGDLARSVSFDARTRRLRVELKSGLGLLVPVDRVEGLAGLPASAIRAVRIVGQGYAMHWPALDLDVSVPALVAGCFGSRAWMAALARAGGKSTSAAKAEAARRNGRKGGRPRREPGITGAGRR